MTDKLPTDAQIRRRWINLGEFVAVAGLLISGLALWNSWKGGDAETRIVEQEQKPVPLALRGRVEDDGKRLVIAPIESGHALDALQLSANAGSIALGSDGSLSAKDVESLLPDDIDKSRDGRFVVTLDARFVERGKDRRGGGRYTLSYRWEEGGLLGGKSLRLTGLSRA
ncbi:MAG TPA: hypothetical protein VFO45_06330 [Sphingomicrobium sp.]|nr:hypothetical protein [Sphingomicrobium sp.]